MNNSDNYNKTYAFMRMDEVSKMCGICKNTIRELMRVGDFPKPRKLSPRCVGWFANEVYAWMENRPVVDV